VIDHGNTLTQQHHQKGIFDLAFPHLTDGNLTGRAFHAAVPGIIIAASVLIAFAIGLVMFIIVAHQVIHGKSVLADHERQADIRVLGDAGGHDQVVVGLLVAFAVGGFVDKLKRDALFQQDHRYFAHKGTGVAADQFHSLLLIANKLSPTKI
jgi:hypothetical protein